MFVVTRGVQIAWFLYGFLSGLHGQLISGTNPRPVTLKRMTEARLEASSERLEARLEASRNARLHAKRDAALTFRATIIYFFGVVMLH